MRQTGGTRRRSARRARALCLVAVTVAALAAVAAAAGSGTYTMTDLGKISDSNAGVVSVNSRDQVAAYGASSDGTALSTFFWTRSSGMIDIGTLGSRTLAQAMNANGQIVGSSARPDGRNHAFSWTQSGGMVDLGTLGGAESTAVAVSDGGMVVGWSDLADGSRHAFAWTATGGWSTWARRPAGRATHARFRTPASSTAP
jgi:probable HAF family extracellular repeat protein